MFHKYLTSDCEIQRRLIKENEKRVSTLGGDGDTYLTRDFGLVSNTILTFHLHFYLHCI